MVDSLNLTSLLAYDTFLLKAPISVKCDANYRNIRLWLTQQSTIRFAGNQRDTLKYFEFFTDTLKYYNAETDTWYICDEPLGAEYFNTANNGFRNHYIKEVNISNLSCINEAYTTPDSMVLIVRGRVLNRITNNAQLLSINTYLQYNQDGCNLNDRDQLRTNVFSGLPQSGVVTWLQPYQRDTNYRGFYPLTSVCGVFELNSTVDNYYFNTENVDPFPNEHREPYLINSVEFRIPDFFEIDSNSFNLIRDFYRSTTREIFSDTSKVPYQIRREPNHWIVTFPYDRNQDFNALRTQFRVNLVPDCYGNFQDTIFVTKDLTHQSHRSSASRKDTIIRQSFLFNVGSPYPQITQKRQQFLFNNQSTTEFNLVVPTMGYQPETYFDYPSTWFIIETATGNLVLDSLIDCTDSVPTIVQPEILGANRWLIRYDSMDTSRCLKLYSTVENCGRDSIILITGSRCSEYPTDWSDPLMDCPEYLDREIIQILPEVPQLIGRFIEWPDSSQTEPCDTFAYLAEIRNANLGHLLDPTLVVDSVEGLVIQSIELEYPELNWITLGAPQSVNGAWTWSLDSIFGNSGLSGFAQPDLNVFKVRIQLIGNCDIQDGAIVSLTFRGKNLCDDAIETRKISAPALRFSPDTTLQNTDVYDVSLDFYGDTACGDYFTMRATFTSINQISSQGNQRLSLIFDKELSYQVGSYQGIRNAPPGVSPIQLLEDQEKFHLDLIQGIPFGDSMVFEARFERTCSGICKSTSFAFELLVPTQIGCATVPGGNCDIRKESQSWEFNDLIVSPYYELQIADGTIERISGGEVLNTNLNVKNLSEFSTPTWIYIDYYDDVNGNGILNAGDILIGVDSVLSTFGPGIRQIDFNSQIIWPEWASCQAIAAVDPTNNPCLCLGDTVPFPPLQLAPQSMNALFCFDQEGAIGFDSIPGYTYDWSARAEIRNPNTSRTVYQSSFDLTPGQRSRDTLYLNSERRSGCSVVDTAFVELYRPVLEVLQLDSILCHGDSMASAKAELLLGMGGATYEWNPGGTGSQINLLPAGTYSVQARDSAGCWDTATIVINQPDSLLQDLTAVSDYNSYGVRCEGESNGWIELDINGGTPSYTVEWNGNQTTGTRLDSLSAGWTYYTVIDDNGCQISDSVFLSTPPGIEYSTVSTLAGCDEEHGATATVLTEGGIEPFQVIWNDGFQGSNRDRLLAGNYSFRIIDGNGCEVMDSLTVDRYLDPLLFVNITDTVVDFGKSIRLLAGSNADSAIYVWFPSEQVSCDTCPWTDVTPTEEMTIEVKVIDENGCEAWALISIRVKITKRVWAPNAFTPDGNTLNDGFTLFGNPTLERIEHLAIFDRWGEQVFQTQDIPPGEPEYGWDGILNGEPMNPAVFAWIARVRFVDGEIRWMSGDVTLIR